MLTRKYKDMDILRFYNDMDEVKEKTGELIATECRFARWIPKTKEHSDYHLVVLVHSYADGTKAKELKLVKDFKRPVWVTKEIHRKYNDKKEFEHVDRLNMITTTQSTIDLAVCRGLGKEPTPYQIANIKDSPYLYGYEVPSTAFIKYHYHIRAEGYISTFNVVNLDIEADVTGEFNDISIITLSMNGCRHTAVMRRLYKDICTSDEDIIKLIRDKDASDLPDSQAKRDTKIFNITVHDNDLDLLTTVFGILHTIKPDFVTIHNLVYDITKIMERLEFWGYNPGDLFCDPSIPKPLRRVVFKPAQQFKIKKGVKYSIPYEEQWSTIDIIASFMIMDTMTGYAFIRQAQGKLVGGYGLGNILEKNDLASKLLYHDENTKLLSGIKYHQYMSTHRPLEYTIYANQDTVGMTNLENKTEDFSTAMPIFAGISDFLRYNSSTHKAICNGYLENRHKGLIVGTTPKNPVDRSYLGTTDWIKTLPSDFIQDIGLPLTNVASITTNVTANADDMDCVSSYPSDIQACNISLATLRAELLEIGNIPARLFKDQNINLISSNGNTIPYCMTMMNMPSPIEVRERAKKIHDSKVNTLQDVL